MWGAHHHPYTKGTCWICRTFHNPLKIQNGVKELNVIQDNFLFQRLEMSLERL
jgi:hypothetical protein